jgi:hypothetical protein
MDLPSFYNHGHDSNIGLDSESMFNHEVVIRVLAIPSHSIDGTKPLPQQGLRLLREL